ncbi:class I adenylate-forming enzyme family protein [Nocardioides sp. Kera G14]|uniref:class I adenylate-forming enzyme family protein n=1 Tax=Nocardioides sp. Kera G14 TaxID=2884264 RepID=UPI001D106A76|nr:class I adenylate-forming enzyme family protein [Nocardioides sp. Kera G14]UDY24906.1 acyl--CoA ligase [Nocardioides sp. Kera G14]
MSPTRDEVVARLTAAGEPFEIAREDVRGQQLEVFVRRHRSLGEILLASARFGDRDYLVSTEERITFADHERMVAALAAALREEYAVGPGDRVAICAANCPRWVVAFWAVIAVGGVAVGMNSMWASEEMRHGIELASPVVVIADAARREVLEEAGVPGVPVIDLDLEVPALIARHGDAALEVPEVDEDDPAVVLFTSGTSGRPKGATHSHRNVIAALWFHLLNDAVATEMGFPPRDRRFLLATPLFHIAALHNLSVVRLAVGDTAVVHLGRFDIDEVLALIERERVTNWGAVPTMLTRLVERAESRGLDDVDLSSLRTVSVNSAPSSGTLKERLRAVLPTAARSLGTSYGLTESSTAATLASAADLEADAETVGRPVPTMEVDVRDGEVWLRGAQMMLGYWGDPVATADSFAPDGWFRTGDLGAIVETGPMAGHLHLVSRRSDLILRGGENVYPAEVEAQLESHPGVRECAVVGVPDEDLGQAVAAVIVLQEGCSLTADDLLDHLRPRLARYKLPNHWAIGHTLLPRNATGKVSRRDIVV